MLVTSPSSSRNRPRRLRGGSHGDVDFKSAAAAAAAAASASATATATTADFESVPGADEELLSSGLLNRDRDLHSDIVSKLRSSPNSSLPPDHGFDSADESDASSTLSSDFMPTADSGPAVIGNSLSPPPRAVRHTEPPVLNALPPPIRPVSMVQPESLLTRLLQAKSFEAESPLDAYRLFSGKGELSPIYLKIYIPYMAAEPFEVILSPLAKQDDNTGRSKETTVADAIGFVLYRYVEEKKTPSLRDEHMDINRWVFRMVDEGEPDDDFPPLERTQPIRAYMAKKPPRSGRLAAANRETKLEGEFALCEATEAQCEREREREMFAKIAPPNYSQTSRTAKPLLARLRPNRLAAQLPSPPLQPPSLLWPRPNRQRQRQQQQQQQQRRRRRRRRQRQRLRH